MRVYWSEKRDALNAQRRQRRKDNPDEVRAAGREKFRQNRDKITAQMRARWHARKGELNAKRQREKYGLTADEIAAMHTKQDGRCAICGDQRKLGVDHDHATGAVRALLCTPCNTALGLLKENPTRIRAALAYLKSRAVAAKTGALEATPQ